MKLFILLILLIGVLLFNGINGDEYVNFIPYSNDECVGDEIGIGYSSLLSKCLPSIDSQQNYLFTLKPKNVIEWKVFKYSNKNHHNNDSCNLNKTTILQPSFTTKIGSCISSEYINLDSKISLSSPTHYKISITKNSPYISAKSIVNSFTFDKKCSSSSNNNNDDDVLLIQYFTNDLNVKLNNKNKISYHCINDKAFTKNQFEFVEPITKECVQFGNGNANAISSLIKNKFVDLKFGFGSGSGSGSGSSGGEDSSSTTGNTGDSSTGNTGESSISSSTGGNSDTSGGNSGFSSDTSGGNSGFSSTTEVTTATSATTGGATSGDDNDGTGATNFIDYKLPNPSPTHHKIFKKTYCSK
ncbi:hypothetical protein DDB_G0284935 [Dictyostelium discoideum AX4]|uniref:Uncharacterized protein n=1 Tax=Dictyostelium discoideum TaxID=44689 RepID=Q54NX6_DICDI|nr:hypothetical protein DDB_G0284935 [Dictyostelium discoideum AX4]EAL64931.1 hypothetical protein DDB_G0284935 [Dictyostelium discoideum AX4]|eukprot:XP_639941.1 hypothetical protein DDB_G0284935 [Dictyostelium discoideum AX4]